MQSEETTKTPLEQAEEESRAAWEAAEKAVDELFEDPQSEPAESAAGEDE